jgi:Bacterial Ig-like domain
MYLLDFLLKKSNILFVFLVISFVFTKPCFSASPVPITSLSPPDNGNILSANLDSNLLVQLGIFDGWINGRNLTSVPGGAINIEIQNGSYADRKLVHSLTILDNGASIGGEGTPQIIINPPSDLLNNSCYIVTITPCLAYSLSVASFEPLCSFNGYVDVGVYEWNFTTGNGICLGPNMDIISENATLLYLSPPNQAFHIQKNQSLNLTFSKNVTQNQGSIVLKKYSDNSVLETIPVSSSQITGWGTNRLIINPSTTFSDDTQFYVNMDLNNFRTASDKNNWTFTIQKQPSVFSGSGL